jgi:hypothetical protein
MSAAVARVRERTAPLGDEYRARSGSPALEAREWVLTIAVLRERRRRGTAAGDTRNADNVDLEDPAPFAMGVALDGARGADTGVVDRDADAAEPPCGLLDRRSDGHVGRNAGRRRGHVVGLEVEAGDTGPAGEQPRHGQSDI